MALALDNAVTSAGGNGTSRQVTISTAGPNRLIVVVCQMNGAGNTQPKINDTAGLTWTLRAHGSAFNGSYGVCEWVAPAASQLAGDVITITQAASYFIIATAVAISGVNVTSPYDPNASVPNAAANSQPVIRTSNSNDFIFGAARVADQTPGALPAPWVTLYNASYWQVGYWIVSATQSNLTVPIDASTNGALADAFVAAGASAPTAYPFRRNRTYLGR